MKVSKVLIILIAVFLFTFAVRLLPYAESSAPLGYDAGLYKYVIERYADSLPDVPESELPGWVRSAYPQGLFLLTDELYLFGLDSLSMLKILFPLLCAFLVFPLFIVVREFFGERAGIIAAVLCALSSTQFHVFSLLYFKNVVGLILMLTSIYLLKKERYGVFTLTYISIGAYHRPTFLLFTLILMAYLTHLSLSWVRVKNNKETRTKIKYLGLAIIAAWVLLAPFYLTRIDLYYDIVFSAIETPGGGTFMDVGAYIGLSLAYLPFAVIGFLHLVRRRDFNILLLWAAINGSIVVFSLLFYNRFIIHQDIALIMLAALGLGYILDSKKMPRMFGATLILAVFVVSGAILLSEVRNVGPSITVGELDALAWLSDNSEKDAYVISLSSEAPWVLGWGGREVIAPGLFGHDEYGKEDWREFLRDGKPDKTKEFLSVYNRPLYIYRTKENGFGFVDFQNECFEKVYDGGAIIYKYLC